MFRVCRVLLIWMTTAMLCVQAIGATSLSECHCQQDRSRQQLSQMASCCGQRQQVPAAETELNSGCCCKNKSEGVDSQPVSLPAFVQTGCACSLHGPTPVLPVQTTQVQESNSHFDLLLVPLSIASVSDRIKIRPARSNPADVLPAQRSAQVLFCVSLT